MSSNNLYKDTLLTNIYGVLQNSFLSYPKEIILTTIKEYFKNSEYYHYTEDQYGFSNAEVDHTDLQLGSDLKTETFGSTAISNINLPSRLSISQAYKFSSIFFPAIIVRSGSFRYLPISASRDQGKILYEELLFFDDYGNSSKIRNPKFFVTSGIYEGEVTIEVQTRSIKSRDDLIESLMILFVDIAFDSLVDVGLVVKPPTASAPTETDDRSDKLFKQTITLPIRLEWSRSIPIGNLIETILFSVEFQNLSNEDSSPVEDLTINTNLNIIDIL